MRLRTSGNSNDMHRIEIDQSNKIEETGKGTTFGASNEISRVVFLSGKIKRKLQEDFRKAGKPRLFVYRTFAAGIVLLLQSIGEQKLHTRIVVDVEYPGWERIILSMILEMWSRASGRTIDTIEFKRVGKRSRAHEVAHATAAGKRKADKIIKYAEIKRLVLK